MALTDSQGSVAERIAYEAFGNGAGSALTRCGFTGRERDAVTGQMYHRARWYDPEQGRFLTEDPIGFASELNLYAYALNNPLSFFDPTGLSFGTLAEGFLEGFAIGGILGYLTAAAMAPFRSLARCRQR